MAHTHDRPDDEQRLDCRKAFHTGTTGPHGLDREQRRERDQWNGGQVLEQKNCEGEPAVTRRQLAFFLEYLQGERRRRQREYEPGEHRRAPRHTEGNGHDPQRQCRHPDLRTTESENGGAHGPQSHGPQFETDEEH